QFVEVRVVFPREQLTSLAGAQLRSGSRLDRILDEEAAFAAADAADRARERWFRDNLPWLVAPALLLAFVPAGVVAAWVYRRHGREPGVGAGPRYVFEPPGDEPPALIAALVASKQARATGDAFTATLFDLIRRGYFSALPATTVKETWGGLRSEDISDLVVSPRRRDAPSSSGSKRRWPRR
ncbi:MAG TPA: hypothetical protein VHN37_04435, partial [Actinomycetota bacterium]|nr:hypothetical protein [Actinomycetota bacterium]